MPEIGLKENSLSNWAKESRLPLLSKQIYFAEKVVLVDGIARTGKSMLGPILSSFERVEIERIEYVFEYVGSLYRLGKIHRDAAAVLLRMEAEIFLYNDVIGRNTNFRWSDHSSVWRNPHPMKYLRRLFAAEGQAAVDWISRERPIFLAQTHDQLSNFDLFREAFGERLRMVEMIRHPVDLVDSWMRRGWGERFGKDPRAFTLGVQVQGQEVPFYAVGWEELYLVSTPLGRIIRMIQVLWQENQRVYEGLTPEEKRQVLLIPFELFVQRPSPYMDRIALFLETPPTRHTRGALRRERCPRPLSLEARRQKQKRIEQELSREEREILERLIESYEGWNGLFY